MIPEPLTITGFVLSVIGFANLARQGAQALYEDTRAYNRASKKLSKILKWSSKLKRSIDLWKMMWGFQEEMHAQYPIALWGDGWPDILGTIESIEDISQEMKQTLTPLAREYEAQKSSQTSSVTNNPQTLRAEAEQRILQRDEDQELMNSQFSWDAKMKFILSKSTELDNFIEELKDLIDGPLGLYKLSEREFRARHQLNTSITDEERQDIGIVGMLLDQARESRQTSCALYKTCFPAEQGTIGLEMSLLGYWDERSNPRPFRVGLPEYLSYYLIIPRTTLSSLAAKSASPKGFQFASGRSIPLQLEVIAEPTNISSGRYKETLIDACADLDQKRTCYLRYTTPGPSASTKPVIFKIRRSSDKLLDSSWKESKLSDLLTVVNYPWNLQHTWISLRERVQVAYRIVECAFLLLGTPWLSNFESSCITGAFAEGKEMRYRVAVIPSRGEWQDSIDAQILRVGKLLHEIALGAEPEPFQETHLARVTQVLGESYGDALRFCFNPASTLRARSSLRTPDQSRVIRDNPLSDFYIEVFEPLAKLYGQRVSNIRSDLTSSTLSFLPTAYSIENPTDLKWDPVPYVRLSRERPATLLGAVRDICRASKKAWSTRSLSIMSGKHRKEVVVFFMSDQKFKLMSEEEVPDYAEPVEIPPKELVLDIFSPSKGLLRGKPLGKLRFEDLGPGAVLRRSLGKINELYVANDLDQYFGNGGFTG